MTIDNIITLDKTEYDKLLNLVPPHMRFKKADIEQDHLLPFTPGYEVIFTYMTTFTKLALELATGDYPDLTGVSLTQTEYHALKLLGTHPFVEARNPSNVIDEWLQKLETTIIGNL